MKRFGIGLVLFALVAAPSAGLGAVVEFRIGPQTGGTIFQDDVTGALVGKDIMVSGYSVDGGAQVALADQFLSFEASPLDPAVPMQYGAGFVTIADPFGFPTLLFGSLSSAAVAATGTDCFTATGLFDAFVDPAIDGSPFGASVIYNGSFSISFAGFALQGYDTATPVQIDGGSVATPPIPEPGTILLLGSGLAGLAGYGRKKQLK